MEATLVFTLTVSISTIFLHITDDPLYYRNRKTVCLVDLTGQNRRLPGLGSRREVHREVQTDEMDPNSPWKAGFSETSGTRNK